MALCTGYCWLLRSCDFRDAKSEGQEASTHSDYVRCVISMAMDFFLFFVSSLGETRMQELQSIFALVCEGLAASFCRPGVAARPRPSLHQHRLAPALLREVIFASLWRSWQ